MTRAPLLALVLAGLAGPALAEMMSVTESASYPMSDEESRKDGRQHCVEAAKHTALDRAGSVFEAEMKSERSETGRDEAKLKMRSYFAGVVSSEMVGDRVDLDQSGRATENCTVKIGYDPDTVSAKMREIADAEGLRKQVAVQQTTIASLQTQVAQAQQPPPPVAAPVTYAPPHALVPAYTPPPAPAPVYYAPRPVYYAPPAARPVLVVRPVRLRVVKLRRPLYWRP